MRLTAGSGRRRRPGGQHDRAPGGDPGQAVVVGEEGVEADGEQEDLQRQQHDDEHAECGGTSRWARARRGPVRWAAWGWTRSLRVTVAPPRRRRRLRPGRRAPTPCRRGPRRRCGRAGAAAGRPAPRRSRRRSGPRGRGTPSRRVGLVVDDAAEVGALLAEGPQLAAGRCTRMAGSARSGSRTGVPSRHPVERDDGRLALVDRAQRRPQGDPDVAGGEPAGGEHEVADELAAGDLVLAGGGEREVLAPHRVRHRTARSARRGACGARSRPGSELVEAERVVLRPAPLAARTSIDPGRRRRCGPWSPRTGCRTTRSPGPGTAGGELLGVPNHSASLGRSRRTSASGRRGAVVAHVALHHLVVGREVLGHPERAGEHAVGAADAAGLERGLHDAVLVLLDGVRGHTSAQVGSSQCMHTIGAVWVVAAVDLLEVDHRRPGGCRTPRRPARTPGSRCSGSGR